MELSIDAGTAERLAWGALSDRACCLVSPGTPDDQKKVRKEENAAKKSKHNPSAHDVALQATSWVEEFLTKFAQVEEIQNEFAKRYDAQVCLDRVLVRLQLRKSDVPGAIQTNSSSRRRG